LVIRAPCSLWGGKFQLRAESTKREERGARSDQGLTRKCDRLEKLKREKKELPRKVFGEGKKEQEKKKGD